MLKPGILFIFSSDALFLLVIVVITGRLAMLLLSGLFPTLHRAVRVEGNDDPYVGCRSRACGSWLAAARTGGKPCADRAGACMHA